MFCLLSSFAFQMHQSGILRSDDLITRFFRLCTEMCVDLCYRATQMEPGGQISASNRIRCFHTLDAYAKLVSLLIRNSGDQNAIQTKTNLMMKVKIKKKTKFFNKKKFQLKFVL